MTNQVAPLPNRALKSILFICVGCLASLHTVAASTYSNKDLHQLVITGNAAALQTELNNGADINTLDSRGQSLLQNALYANQTDVVMVLLENGADANEKAKNFKKTPLFFTAIEKSNLPLVKAMLERGADAAATDTAGRTGIDYAILHYEPGIVKLLLDSGTQLDNTKYKGERQLLSAIFNEDPIMVFLLLQYGATTSMEALVEHQCARCHDLDSGRGHFSHPYLDGQNYQYMLKQLYDFRSGERKAAYGGKMGEVLNAMNDDMLELAAKYYSNLPFKTRYQVARTDSVLRGEQLFNQGSSDASITACVSCHSPELTANNSEGIPYLFGQNTNYTDDQLKRYRNGIRNNDTDAVMRKAAAALTDQHISDLAAYLQSVPSN